MPHTGEITEHTTIPGRPRVSPDERMEMFHSRLKERALKSTGQRDDIARVFFALGRHVSAEELYAEVKKVNPHVGYATIYRTLKLLKECELVSERHFDDGQGRYEIIDEQRHHDHFICEQLRPHHRVPKRAAWSGSSRPWRGSSGYRSRAIGWSFMDAAPNAASAQPKAPSHR